MSRRRIEISILGALLAVTGIVAYMETRTSAAGIAGIPADNAPFEPLKIQEPQLRLDLLEKLQKLGYNGSHRDIFSAVPPPMAPIQVRRAEQRPVGDPYPIQPPPPPPPPPLVILAQCFGYASMSDTSKRVAFFSSGDDVLVVAEGDTFLNRFRLVHVGPDTADVEEISSGRHATLQIVRPPDQAPN